VHIHLVTLFFLIIIVRVVKCVQCTSECINELAYGQMNVDL